MNIRKTFFPATLMIKFQQGLYTYRIKYRVRFELEVKVSSPALYTLFLIRIKKTGRYYIGQTQDLTKHLIKHSRGQTKSIKNRGEFDVVYMEEFSSRSEAMKREKEIKRYKGGEAFKRLLTNQVETVEVRSLAG